MRPLCVLLAGRAAISSWDVMHGWNMRCAAMPMNKGPCRRLGECNGGRIARHHGRLDKCQASLELDCWWEQFPQPDMM